MIFSDFMRFKNEVYLVLVLVLYLIWFNPTNLFVDWLITPALKAFIDFTDVFAYISFIIIFCVKIFLAYEEVKLLEMFFPEKKSVAKK
jgi:hypothetical protein